MLGTILLIILILILIGALPTWPYSSGWGYYPSGGVGLILIILVVLLLMGRYRDVPVARVVWQLLQYRNVTLIEPNW